MAYDLPPPAAPPYSTSVSPAARKSSCGPSLALKITSSTASAWRAVGMSSSSSALTSFAAFSFSSLLRVFLVLLIDFLQLSILFCAALSFFSFSFTLLLADCFAFVSEWQVQPLPFEPFSRPPFFRGVPSTLSMKLFSSSTKYLSGLMSQSLSLFCNFL